MGGGRVAGAPASMTTRRRARPSTSAALRPAAPPPTTTTSYAALCSSRSPRDTACGTPPGVNHSDSTEPVTVVAAVVGFHPARGLPWVALAASARSSRSCPRSSRRRSPPRNTVDGWIVTTTGHVRPVSSSTLAAEPRHSRVLPEQRLGRRRPEADEERRPHRSELDAQPVVASADVDPAGLVVDPARTTLLELEMLDGVRQVELSVLETDLCEQLPQEPACRPHEWTSCTVLGVPRLFPGAHHPGIGSSLPEHGLRRMPPQIAPAARRRIGAGLARSFGRSFCARRERPRPGLPTNRRGREGARQKQWAGSQATRPQPPSPVRRLRESRSVRPSGGRPFPDRGSVEQRRGVVFAERLCHA